MNAMTQSAIDHYGAAGLLPRIRDALATFGPEWTQLSVPQLAGLDHFHTGGITSTGAVAKAAGLRAGMKVLDLGCGIGGPARFLAAIYDVDVVGIDISTSFVDTARYLSVRCNLQDRTTFELGDAVDPPVEEASFDRVFLLHVAMNISDRADLYRSIRRVLKPGGRLATYDVVAGSGDLHFPVPWSSTPGGSHLLSANETRLALVDAGFRIELASDETQIATKWFGALQASGPPPGPNLGLVLGAGFPGMTGNLARNLHEGRAGIFTVIASRQEHHFP